MSLSGNLDLFRVVHGIIKAGLNRHRIINLGLKLRAENRVDRMSIRLHLPALKEIPEFLDRGFGFISVRDYDFRRIKLFQSSRVNHLLSIVYKVVERISKAFIVTHVLLCLCIDFAHARHLGLRVNRPDRVLIFIYFMR